MMATEDTIITTCANCGKGEESSGDLKACTACKLVKYCNRECQIAHRPRHKTACKIRVAELHDEALFKEHTPEECPICFLPLPLEGRQAVFHSCCGKLICYGCIYAMGEEACGRGGEIGLCAFCRTPAATSEEETIKQVKKLMEVGNAYAFYNFAGYYEDGNMGMPQDFAKANELWLKAGELGCAVAYSKLGSSYCNGDGVEVDKKKAMHYCELAAMNGDVYARHNLGSMEYEAGNHYRVYKHFILSARAEAEAVERTKKCSESGNADAFHHFAGFYDRGVMGMPQDIAKANEFYLRAGELGCANAHCNLGIAYENGRGVEVDKKKAKYFCELAAINGYVDARHNLGCIELEAGKYDRAYKHFILSARAGDKLSLDAMKQGFLGGMITKEDYANTLRAYQEQHDEMKSDARDRARAVRNSR